MAHFCWFLNLLFLLLMLSRAPTIDTRPSGVSNHQSSDIIAGNEFLKLFLKRDKLQPDKLHRIEEDNDETNNSEGGSITLTDDDHDGYMTTTKKIVGRSTNARSLDYKGRNGNLNANADVATNDDHYDDVVDGKKVVKLVTTGSKIVFLEEYDEDDAVIDSVVREIDLKKDKTKNAKQKQQATKQQSDEIKVVAVSVSSSSKRSRPSRERASTESAAQSNKFTYTNKSDRRQQNIPTNDRKTSTTVRPARAMTTSTTPTTPTTTTSTPSTTTDYINRSHKSEFSIEEAEPMTMMQHKTHHSRTASTSLDDIDSQNSASTNIHNVLAAPHAQSGSNRNFSHAEHNSTDDSLLPIQTVIYHDTKQGHGPQSRSISYSSISQNVQDVRAWQHSGILAEAQRNVSESLKAIPRAGPNMQASQPAKFYSVPAKMYGEPSKFYSEPAKVYSEPAKNYGQAEKVYSEPAKVYGQPSMVYSEPSKVYSQPSKIYSEPAKTYWPTSSSSSSSLSSPSTITTTTTVATPKSQSTSTMATPMRTTTQKPITNYPTIYPSSRRPAIVSRIAFGEAQTTSSPPTQATNYQSRQQAHSNTYQSNVPTNTQPRRILYNLDKLPYDLLNAPQQSSKNLLDPELLNKPPASVTYATDKQDPCLESALSSLSVSAQQQRQHSSTLSDKHSNQNAKGLSNRDADLVKCVSKFSISSGAGAHFSATANENSHHDDDGDLYTASPEQNYEIEESVSVMSNGRSHGNQGTGGSAITTPSPSATATISPAWKPTRGRMRYDNVNNDKQVPSYNANSNVGDDEEGDDDGDGDHYSNHNYNDDDIVDTNNKHDGVSGGGGGGGGVGEDDDDAKVAYVVEGRNYRKYRVEEKTDDGFIVGEYGVVDHNDGNLRGVRYTADSTINRSLIQQALLTFLKLK